MSPKDVPLEVDCIAVKARLDAGDDFLLLDCREQDEHDLVHIRAAMLLPMSQLLARADELNAHRGRDIVVHCHHGGRSLRVAQWLRDQGFSTAQSMAGGIDQWAAAIDPALLRY
jgi:rhodanese-related sulfurtransferase